MTRCVSAIAFTLALGFWPLTAPQAQNTGVTSATSATSATGATGQISQTRQTNLTGPTPVSVTPSARDMLSVEIARMEAEIAALARYSAWQEKLLEAAKSDPAAALAQRLPMSECRASALAPICHRLTGLFAPNAAEEGP